MDADAGAAYRVARLRLTELLRPLPPSTWATPVPACPGWDVKAVVSHLAGNVDDALAGRLTGPPADAQTAEQVARYADVAPGDLLDSWAEAALLFDDIVSRFELWPAALDALTHEHDIRGAIGEPGERDDELFRLAARLLVDGAELPVTVTFDVGDERISSADTGAPAHEVVTTAFEVSRIRLGRRSPDQVLAMPWSPPLPAAPDELFIFGPRRSALVE